MHNLDHLLHVYFTCDPKKVWIADMSRTDWYYFPKQVTPRQAAGLGKMLQNMASALKACSPPGKVYVNHGIATDNIVVDSQGQFRFMHFSDVELVDVTKRVKGVKAMEYNELMALRLLKSIPLLRRGGVDETSDPSQITFSLKEEFIKDQDEEKLSLLVFNEVSKVLTKNQDDIIPGDLFTWSDYQVRQMFKNKRVIGTEDVPLLIESVVEMYKNKCKEKSSLCIQSRSIVNNTPAELKADNPESALTPIVQVNNQLNDRVASEYAVPRSKKLDNFDGELLDSLTQVRGMAKKVLCRQRMPQWIQGFLAMQEDCSEIIDKRLQDKIKAKADKVNEKKQKYEDMLKLRQARYEMYDTAKTEKLAAKQKDYERRQQLPQDRLSTAQAAKEPSLMGRFTQAVKNEFRTGPIEQPSPT